MPAQPQPEGFNKTTILIVDDEPINNEMVERAFRTKGFRVLAARSGQAALQLLGEDRVDVMLVDQSMPQMTGVQFLERALQVMPDAIGIMVTGYPELQDVIEAKKRGLVHHIIAKPWRKEELVAAVALVLKMRDMRKAVDSLKMPGER